MQATESSVEERVLVMWELAEAMMAIAGRSLPAIAGLTFDEA
jgi:hypothetical protein